MSEPRDMVMPVLRDIQAELAAFRKETNDRLAKLEVANKNLRSAMAGETVLSRMLVGEYEGRIEALEQRFDALEGGK